MIEISKIIKEPTFKAIRSSGSGGQHVNKVSSKVELQFNITDSSALNEKQKALLIKNLSAKLTKHNVLILQCGESRSQHKNKTLVIQRFLKIIEQGLKVKRKRIATKIPKAVIQKRLNTKRLQSEKKASRKKLKY